MSAENRGNGEITGGERTTDQTDRDSDPSLVVLVGEIDVGIKYRCPRGISSLSSSFHLVVYLVFVFV